MKYLKKYKVFESSFVSEEEMNNILDKISKDGIESISKSELNRLKLYSKCDESVIDIIRKMAEYTRKFHEWNKRIEDLTSEYRVDIDNEEFEEKRDELFKEWNKLNKGLRKLESSLENDYGINLGSLDLRKVMSEVAPDVYGGPIM